MIGKNDLENIEWSDDSLSLSKFVNTFTLPQIVQVYDGYDGGSYENTLGNMDILKLHKLTKEKKLLCQNHHGKSFVFPIRDQRIHKKQPKVVFRRVSELARAKALPPYVTVTIGYCCKQKDGQNINLEPGEILEVVEINNASKLSFKNIAMTFRNDKGVLLKLPHDCVAGFETFIDVRPQSLANVVPDKPKPSTFPFDFTFLDQKGLSLGVLKATSAREENLIMASSTEGENELIFLISPDLPVSVKVAVGTLKYDAIYESVKTVFSNYQSLEQDMKSSAMYKDLDYCTNEVGLYSMLLPKIPEREPIQNNNESVDNVAVVAVNQRINSPLIPPRDSEAQTSEKPSIPAKPKPALAYKKDSVVAPVSDYEYTENTVKRFPLQKSVSDVSHIAQINMDKKIDLNIQNVELHPVSANRPSMFNNYTSAVSKSTDPSIQKRELPRPLPPVSTKRPSINHKSISAQNNNEQKVRIEPTTVSTKLNTAATGNVCEPLHNHVPTKRPSIDKESISVQCNNEQTVDLKPRALASTLPCPTVTESQYEPLGDINKKYLVYEVLKMDSPVVEENDKGASIAEIKKMNTDTFAEILRILHMSQHVENFARNQVNGALFCELDEEELVELGLGKFEIKKLLRFKNGWRPT